MNLLVKNRGINPIHLRDSGRLVREERCAFCTLPLFTRKEKMVKEKKREIATRRKESATRTNVKFAFSSFKSELKLFSSLTLFSHVTHKVISFAILFPAKSMADFPCWHLFWNNHQYRSHLYMRKNTFTRTINHKQLFNDYGLR